MHHLGILTIGVVIEYSVTRAPGRDELAERFFHGILVLTRRASPSCAFDEAPQQEIFGRGQHPGAIADELQESLAFTAEAGGILSVETFPAFDQLSPGSVCKHLAAEICEIVAVGWQVGQFAPGSQSGIQVHSGSCVDC